MWNHTSNRGCQLAKGESLLNHSMRIRSEDLAKVADESVKEEFGYGRWLVYDYKAVRIDKGEDAYVKVPLVPGKTPEKPYEYNPLLVRGLFLEFAELAEGSEITQEDWLDWTKRWGVLGVGWREGPVNLHRGGIERNSPSSMLRPIWPIGCSASTRPPLPRMAPMCRGSGSCWNWTKTTPAQPKRSKGGRSVK